MIYIIPGCLRPAWMSLYTVIQKLSLESATEYLILWLEYLACSLCSIFISHFLNWNKQNTYFTFEVRYVKRSKGACELWIQKCKFFSCAFKSLFLDNSVGKHLLSGNLCLSSKHFIVVQSLHISKIYVLLLLHIHR